MPSPVEASNRHLYIVALNALLTAGLCDMFPDQYWPIMLAPMLDIYFDRVGLDREINPVRALRTWLSTPGTSNAQIFRVMPILINSIIGRTLHRQGFRHAHMFVGAFTSTICLAQTFYNAVTADYSSGPS